MDKQDFNWSYTDENGNKIILADKNDIIKFLKKYYQTYKSQIEDLTKDESFDFEQTKKDLFSGRDYVPWSYRK